MFLLPLVALAAVVVAAVALTRRHPHPAAAHGGVVAVEHHAFWPSTPAGWAAVGSIALAVFFVALVNVVQVPFLLWILVALTVLCAAVARLVYHDHSLIVLAVVVVAGISLLAALAFVAGEVFIGHD